MDSSGTYSLGGQLRTVYELGKKRDFLRRAYEAADKRVRSGISVDALRLALGMNKDEADRACEFWLREGALRWLSPPGYLALTGLGVMRAQRLERDGWSVADL